MNQYYYKKIKKYTSNIYNIRVSKKSYKTLDFTNFMHIQFSFHPIYNYFEQEVLQNIYKYKTILIFRLQ